MKYPILVHKDDQSDYSVTIPDFPGCFTAGASIEETLLNVQEAVECFYLGEENVAVPDPSDITDLMNNTDLYTEGGFWIIADIDFGFLAKKTVRVNITVPEYKLSMIDKKAKAKGLSRSAFLVAAAEQVTG